MHRAGLAGVPRRTADPTYETVTYESSLGAIGELRFQIALGSLVLTLSLVLFFVHLALSGFRTGTADTAVAESIPPALSGPENAPGVLENLRLWSAIAILLVALTYVLPLAAIAGGTGLFGNVDGGVPVVIDIVRLVADLAVSTLGGIL